MSTGMGVTNQDWVLRLGWGLVHSIWQGALGALVFGVVRFGLRRCSANLRYLAACAMLAAVVAGPVITVCRAPAWLLPEGAAPLLGPNRRTAVSAGPASEQPNRLAQTVPGNATVSLVAWLDQALPGVVLLWLAGVLVCSGRWAHGCWQIRQWRTTQLEHVTAEWLGVLDELRLRLGLSRPVQLFQSALVEVPTVVGWCRPMILLPITTLAGLTPAQLEAILAHELAHVRRGDYLVNLMQNVIETLMFYHPAVWWLSRCIREEREHCCDDLVLEAGGNRLAYAQALATLDDLRASLPRLAFGASGGPLLRRIRRLAGVVEDRPLGKREFSGLTLMALGVSLVLAGLALTLGPRYFQARTLLRVTPQNLAVQISEERGNATFKLQNPAFLQTECAIAQSDEVLGQMVDRLELVRAWRLSGGDERAARAEALTRLRGRLAVKPMAGTELLEVRSLSTEPQEAAALANAVAPAYERIRNARQERARTQGVRALSEREAAMQRQIREAEKKAEALRRELNVPDAWVQANGPTESLTAERRRHIGGLHVEASAEYARQHILVERLKLLSGESLTQALLTTPGDSLLTELRSQLDTTEIKVAGLRRDYGDQHPEVLRATAALKLLQEKVAQRVSGILQAMELRVAACKTGLETLQKAVEDGDREDQLQAQATQPFFKAKRELDELRRFHALLHSKLASEEADTAMARRPVEVIDPAAAPASPISPNHPRAVAVMFLGCLVGTLGLWLVRASV